jgi:hypothetical protein
MRVWRRVLRGRVHAHELTVWAVSTNPEEDQFHCEELRRRFSTLVAQCFSGFPGRGCQRRPRCSETVNPSQVDDLFLCDQARVVGEGVDLGVELGEQLVWELSLEPSRYVVSYRAGFRVRLSAPISFDREAGLHYCCHASVGFAL